MNEGKSADNSLGTRGYLRRVFLDSDFVQKLILRFFELLGVLVVAYFGWLQIFGSVVSGTEFLNTQVELAIYILFVLSCLAILGPIVAVVWISRKKRRSNGEEVQKLIPQIIASGQKVLRELVVIETSSIRIGGRALNIFKKGLFAELDNLEILTTRLSKTWGNKIQKLREDIPTYNLGDMGKSAEVRGWQKVIKDLLKSLGKELE